MKFKEISIKGKKSWIDENGKRRQKTKKFFQTINPFNRNDDGTVKTEKQILSELVKMRNEWMRMERTK